jgi:plastocyanin
MLADRTFRLAAVLTASLALVACGETTRIVPTSKATPRNVATVPPTVFPAPTTPAPVPSEGGSPTSAPATTAPPAKPNSVLAAGTSFTPNSLTVKAGTKVTWTAQTGEAHSVTSGEPSKADPTGQMNAPIGFTTYSVTFKKPGTYKYFCQPHGTLGMVGEIVVT